MTYSTIVAALCKAQAMDKAVEVLNREWSYTRLLHSGRVDDAMLNLEQMISEGVAPNIVIFSTIIHSLCTSGKREKAELIFEMINRGICPDTISFNPIIDNLCKEGRFIESENSLA
uniref:Pentacotripeptide-repeat region of PRORP domain-containing protein n=1 Tax=Oryza punctata TaxID=4537 RepID=A0A0E0M9C2_ORYPU